MIPASCPHGSLTVEGGFEGRGRDRVVACFLSPTADTDFHRCSSSTRHCHGNGVPKGFTVGVAMRPAMRRVVRMVVIATVSSRKSLSRSACSSSARSNRRWSPRRRTASGASSRRRSRRLRGCRLGGARGGFRAAPPPARAKNSCQTACNRIGCRSGVPFACRLTGSASGPVQRQDTRSAACARRSELACTTSRKPGRSSPPRPSAGRPRG